MIVRSMLKKSSGVSLIEILIALVLSSILIAALYRTFISQQKTYTVQDQIAESQQNARVAIQQMTMQIRMAGNIPGVFDTAGDISPVFGNVNGFTKIITPLHNANNIGTHDDSITIITADQVSTLTQDAAMGSPQLNLSNASSFHSGKKKYLCLKGQNNYLVKNVSGSTITLVTPLAEDHLINEPVFLVKAITYKLRWDNTNPTMPVLVEDENTGGGSQVIAENIEALQFHYVLSDGTMIDSPADPAAIQMVRVEITARTRMPDPQLTGDGYRRRHLDSFVKVRNLGL